MTSDLQMTLQRPDRFRRLDEAVESFEVAVQRDASTDVRAFLPRGTDPEDRRLAIELLCVDLQYRWRRPERRTLEQYRRDFPEFLADQESLSELAREEYRLRRSGGEQADPEEYQRRWQIDTRGWCDDEADPTEGIFRADTAVSELRSEFDRLADSILEFPVPGESLGEFELLEELGRGTFSVVYLARQGGLENRPVVLKVTTGANLEAAHLARLQHTNIVPIYSFHAFGSLHVICMPFFGRQTLADALPISRPGTLDPRVDSRRARGHTDLALRSDALDRRRFDEPTVIRIATQLAAALRHAHGRGIVHRDLKPANVLLADDGTAMLLDFNLSDDLIVGGRVSWLVGGTMPYMSPEHLESTLTGDRVGAAADLYSLGVLMYQMLTGELPFRQRSGPFQRTVAECLEDRRQLPVSPREIRRDISPAMDSIVRRCLAFDVSERYDRMDLLCEDLARQQADRPLAHAPNPSLAERFRKWCRRHPRLSSGAGISTAAALAVILLTLALFGYRQQIAQQRAAVKLQQLQASLPEMRALGSIPGADRSTLDEAIDLSERLVDQYGVFSDPNWRRESSVHALADSQQSELMRTLSEYLRLIALARSERSRVMSELDESGRDRQLASRAADLARQLESLAAQDSVRRADPQPAGSMAAIESLRQGNYEEAIVRFEKLRQRQPYDVSLWLLLGNAYAGAGRWSEAEGCFTVCVTLWPNSHLGYFYRGLSRMDLRKYLPARDDFSEVLAQRSDFVPVLINRAVASREAGQTDDAIADLNRAIELDGDQPRLYLMRAELVEKTPGGRRDAVEDRKRALEIMPHDERNWIARGLARLSASPQQALEDFQQAAALNPFSHAAHRNMAHVYAERLGRPRDALVILDELIGHQPARVEDLVSRSVIYARLGQRTEALADARRVWKAAPGPKEIFQLGCVYALTSAQNQPDAAVAIALIAESIRKEDTWLHVARIDPDLANLRELSEFQEMLQDAQRQVKRQRPRAELETTE